MRPTDFAAQLNVSLANGWGIVRTVTDMCMKMPEGKYVLVKDPNKVRHLVRLSTSIPWFINLLYMLLTPNFFLQPVIRLYAVPASTFAGDDDDALGDLSEEE